MRMRRGQDDAREPRRQAAWADADYDASDSYQSGQRPSSGRHGAYRAPAASRELPPEQDGELAPRLTLRSVPRVPIYAEPTSMREQAVLVPGRDSGKFAAMRQTNRVPAAPDERQLRSHHPYDAPTDDWEAAEQWQASQSWDERHQMPPERALAPAGIAGDLRPATHRHARSRTPKPIKAQASRWWTARYVLVVLAAVVALTTTCAATGQIGNVLATFQANAGSKQAKVVAQQVHAITSLKHPEQFDSTAQYNLYGGASCSPTVLAEVLTAWGVPNATIGHMVDDLGSYLSPSAGLLDQKGFQAVAAKYNMRADISWNMSYNQMLYLANVLGIPVIVNFRSCSGYYYDLCGGHFLVVTGGDQNGVNVVDSSEYYMKYLTRSTFDQLWYWRGDGTAMTVVIAPQTYQYTLPNV